MVLFLHCNYKYLIHLSCFSCKKRGEDNREVIYTQGTQKEEEDISKL